MRTNRLFPAFQTGAENMVGAAFAHTRDPLYYMSTHILIVGDSRGIGQAIAPAVEHLLSDASAWMTEQTLHVDGGINDLRS